MAHDLHLFVLMKCFVMLSATWSHQLVLVSEFPLGISKDKMVKVCLLLSAYYAIVHILCYHAYTSIKSVMLMTFSMGSVALQ